MTLWIRSARQSLHKFPELLLGARHSAGTHRRGPGARLVEAFIKLTGRQELHEYFEGTSQVWPKTSWRPSKSGNALGPALADVLVSTLK